MNSTAVVNNGGHDDIMTFIAFDASRKRAATCSLDYHVKVWNIDKENGKWMLSCSWKAHNGAVWKADWADPKFGQLLATCSYDGTVNVWQEAVIRNARGTMEPTWMRRGNIKNDSRTSIIDVKFCPETLQLVLGSCSADGILCFYKAENAQWSLEHKLSLNMSTSCFAWNSILFSNVISNSMIAIGCNDKSNTKSSKLFICEYNEFINQWTKTGSIKSVTHPVYDLKFAPNIGRPYCLLGIATKNVRILKFIPINRAKNGFLYKIETAAQFNDHSCIIQSISWKPNSNDLASSGEDGCIRFWDENSLGTWKCAQVISAPKEKPKLIQTPVQKSIATRFLQTGLLSYPNQIFWD